MADMGFYVEAIEEIAEVNFIPAIIRWFLKIKHFKIQASKHSKMTIHQRLIGLIDPSKKIEDLDKAQ